jgi:hypothetical protein
MLAQVLELLDERVECKRYSQASVISRCNWFCYFCVCVMCMLASKLELLYARVECKRDSQVGLRVLMNDDCLACAVCILVLVLELLDGRMDCKRHSQISEVGVGVERDCQRRCAFQALPF